MVWLLPLNLGLLAGVLALRLRQPVVRGYFVATAVGAATLMALTETFSALHALTATPALATQGLIALVLAALLFRQRGEVYRHIRAGLRRPNHETLLSWGLPALVLSVTAYLAWISPPNTVDSWTYHLARVAHWAQNHSIAPYPTHIVRQIYQMPWAEETILWLHLLSGNDHWAAFVQWWALLSLFIILPDFVGLLVPEANATWPRWVAAAIPMAILQASSTQNDLVVAYWAVGFVYALLLYLRTRNPHWLLAGALALGLALRTKGTAYLWLFPFGVWWLVLMLRRKAWRWLALAAVVTALLVAGPWYRNEIVFGHPLGSRTIRQFYLVDDLTPRRWVANSLKQMASQATAGYPYLPHTDFSLATPVETGVRWVHQHLLHLAPSDPHTTEAGHTFSVPYRKQPREDETGAFSHLLLLLLATPLALWKGPRALRGYTLIFWAAWGLFTAFIKWQPWITRLQLPWLLLGVPLIVWLLQAGLRERKIAQGLMLLFFLTLVPRPLFQNIQRPLQGANRVTRLSANELLFLPMPTQRQTYVQAMDILAKTNCHEIGLYATENTPEYVFWYLLAPRKPHLRIEHILVTNPTARFASHLPPFSPCAIIVARPHFEAPLRWQVLGQSYRRTFADASAPLFIYLREP